MDESAAANNGGPLQRKVTITNPHGFHLRPMQLFVELAGKFQCAVRLSRPGSDLVDGKSMWGLLPLASEQGTEFTLEVHGPDGPLALEALADLLTNLETRVNVEQAE